MMRLPILAATVAAAAVAAPTASAATLQTLPCYVPGQSVAVQGTGWTAGATVQVGGGAFSASGIVDAAGNVAAQGVAPSISGSRRTPKTFPFTGTDGTLSATGAFQVVNPGFKWAGNGNPRGKVAWSFGALAPNKTIYVHVRRGSTTLKTTRVGRAKAPCGTATKRLPRLPVRSSQVKTGSYTIVADNLKRYRKGGLNGLQYSVGYGVSFVPVRR